MHQDTALLCPVQLLPSPHSPSVAQASRHERRAHRFCKHSDYMPMKLYLHYDGARGPDHTFVWQSGGAPAQQITGRSLARAMAGFVDSYNGKHGQGAYDGGGLFLLIFCVCVVLLSLFRCENSCVYLRY